MNMADLDDDAPPPLSSLMEQVDALKLRGHGEESTSGRTTDVPGEGSPRVANVVIMAPNAKSGPAPKPSTAAAAPAFKKGFFDAAPKKKVKPQAEKKPVEPAVEEIPMIRAKKGMSGGPVIPDFLRVEPDENEKRYAAMKAELLETLKPTPEMVSKIGQDASLLAGFDDPEVMAAVSDIAANPANFKKYKDKPKVLAFYSSMGKMMGDKLEKAGSPLVKQGQM